MKVPLPPYSPVAAHLGKEPSCSSLELRGQRVVLKGNADSPFSVARMTLHRRLEFLKTSSQFTSQSSGSTF